MKSVLITGANRGIGWEVAKKLSAADCFVYLACRDGGAGKQAAETLRKEGRTNVSHVVLDVTDQESVERAAQVVADRGAGLDVLINNAGILGRHPENEPIPVEEIERVFETNYFGVIRVTRAFLPLLRKSTAPRIVNVTSELGSLTLQSDPEWVYGRFKSEAYPPSKAALNMYTVVLAAELAGEPFKVNTVSPGYTATAFNNYRGTKSPSDAADVIIRYATLGPDGPTGGFFADQGGVPW